MYVFMQKREMGIPHTPALQHKSGVIKVATSKIGDTKVATYWENSCSFGLQYVIMVSVQYSQRDVHNLRVHA